jgi:hypothetical protein
MRSQLWKVGVLVVLLSSLSSQIGFAADRKKLSDGGKTQSGYRLDI